VKCDQANIENLYFAKHHVAKAGYQILGRVIEECPPDSPFARRYDYYDPLEDSRQDGDDDKRRMFLALAKVEPENGASAKEFANRYGLLGFPTLSPIGATYHTRELLNEWWPHVLWLNDAVSLWQGIPKSGRHGDVSRDLIKRFRPIRDESGGFGGWHYFLPEKMGKYPPNPTVIEVPKPDSGEVSENDFITAIALTFCQVVNWFFPRGALLTLQYDTKHRVPVLRLQFQDLVGVAWYQLVAAASNLGTIRKCEACERLVLAQGDDKRSAGIRFCSQKCKKKAQRRRTSDSNPGGLSNERSKRIYDVRGGREARRPGGGKTGRTEAETTTARRGGRPGTTGPV
jgi:hypothetical protein